MKIRVEYGEDEMKEIILSHHRQRVCANPPEGDVWNCEARYDKYVVTNVPIAEPVEATETATEPVEATEMPLEDIF